MLNSRQVLRQVFILILVATSIARCSEVQSNPTAKQALLVIYSQFEEHEYTESREVLESRGVVVTVASSSMDILKGHKGLQVKPDILLNEAQASNYDAIVFIGGIAYDSPPEAERLVRAAAAEGKVLAAICIAPVTLARAGVLEGKRATASISPTLLESRGAIFTGNPVERDGLIITAFGPEQSRQFAEAVVAALEE
jgi:protease I